MQILHFPTLQTPHADLESQGAPCGGIALGGPGLESERSSVNLRPLLARWVGNRTDQAVKKHRPPRLSLQISSNCLSPPQDPRLCCGTGRALFQKQHSCPKGARSHDNVAQNSNVIDSKGTNELQWLYYHHLVEASLSLWGVLTWRIHVPKQMLHVLIFGRLCGAEGFRSPFIVIRISSPSIFSP